MGKNVGEALVASGSKGAISGNEVVGRSSNKCLGIYLTVP